MLRMLNSILAILHFNKLKNATKHSITLSIFLQGSFQIKGLCEGSDIYWLVIESLDFSVNLLGCQKVSSRFSIQCNRKTQINFLVKPMLCKILAQHFWISKFVSFQCYILVILFMKFKTHVLPLYMSFLPSFLQTRLWAQTELYELQWLNVW